MAITDKLTGILPKGKTNTAEETFARQREQCLLRGGRWDGKKCILPEKTPAPTEAPPKAPLTQPEISGVEGSGGKQFTVNLPNGQTLVGVSKAEARGQLENFAGKQIQTDLNPVGTEQRIRDQQLQAEQLGQQVGQVGQLPVSPTGLDFGEAATTGIINAIPGALRNAVTGAGIGFGIGAGAGTIALPGIGTVGGAAAGAVVGGVGGFLAGVTSSMISNFKSQRTDTTTAQQRVLDEGKQNLNDWATLAAADPANRSEYIKNFNMQLALIDQAYRQMKLDTSRDVAKFETALPNLAEFEAFYSSQGERDFLTARMLTSLQVQSDPEFIYRVQELGIRRGAK